MSEEKKNLTEEERKELKENMKKKIDEMSDEELDKVAGGIVYFVRCEKCGEMYNVFGSCPKCNPDKYKCVYCGTQFSGERSLINHLSECPNRPDDSQFTIS